MKLVGRQERGAREGGFERVCGREGEERRGGGQWHPLGVSLSWRKRVWVGAGGFERPRHAPTLWALSAPFPPIGCPIIPPSPPPLLPLRSPLDVVVRTTSRVPLVGSLMAYASEMLATLTEYYTYTSGS